MKIDRLLDDYRPEHFVDQVIALDRMGYDGLLMGERNFDPFLTLMQASQHTHRMELATSIALAFPRSPTHVAYAANDLQVASQGRFILGLGTQVRAHIERRFSATWDRPVAQMREFVEALHAIFRCWSTGEALDVRGTYYSLDLMTPYFTPEPHPFSPPPIWLAAMGPQMCQLAGEVADGVFLHPFTSRSFLVESTLPSIHAGRTRAHTAKAIGLAMPVLIAVGSDEQELDRAILCVRKQLAFYGSTPAYRHILEHHGYGDLQTELNALAKAGQWDEMPRLIDDSLLNAFAAVGEGANVGREVADRFGDVLARVSLYTPNYDPRPEVLADVIDAIRAPDR